MYGSRGRRQDLGRRQFRRIPADAKVTRRKTTLRWNTRGELMTPIEKPKR
jgi:hypothetical protein